MKEKDWLVIGQDFDPKIKNKVFILNIYDHIDKTEFFDPKSYFVTSGDAVFKTTYMISELNSRISKEEDPATLESLKYSLSQANSLMEKLLKARGPDCFLETEWDQHVLKCLAKNPRL